MTNVENVDELIRGYGYTNFKSVDEGWSIYLLEDETIVKLKVIPLKFFKRDTDYQ